MTNFKFCLQIYEFFKISSRKIQKWVPLISATKLNANYAAFLHS